jgi:hypothetical protein
MCDSSSVGPANDAGAKTSSTSRQQAFFFCDPVDNRPGRQHNALN